MDMLSSPLDVVQRNLSIVWLESGRNWLQNTLKVLRSGGMPELGEEASSRGRGTCWVSELMSFGGARRDVDYSESDEGET
jgi:hypothetical protein